MVTNCTLLNQKTRKCKKYSSNIDVIVESYEDLVRDVSICEAPISTLLYNHMIFLSQTTRTKLSIHAKFRYFFEHVWYLFYFSSLERHLNHRN
jgi:hypothetical protein